MNTELRLGTGNTSRTKTGLRGERETVAHAQTPGKGSSATHFPRSEHGRRWMRQATYLKAFRMTVISVILSWVITIAIMYMTSGDVAAVGLVIATIVPCLVAFPAVAYHEKNRMALAAAHQELATAHDKLVAMHNKTQAIARKDFLTGLYNREFFLKSFGRRLLRQHGDGALLILDADHFKSINDNYGHHAGDEALKLLANAMSASLREEDLLGRFGGEEFAIYLPATSLREARIIAERIRKSIYAIEFEPVPGVMRRLSVSIGAVACDPAASVTKIFSNADAALYKAKQSGRNRVVLHRQNVRRSQKQTLTGAA